MKRAFKYRFSPTDAQAAELARTFGCVRKVYNLALAARTEAWTLRHERVNYNATSAMLTAWKKSRRSAEYTTSAFRFGDGKLTVSRDAAGRWFVSLLVEDPAIRPLPANGRAVGVDAGLDHLLTLSTGEKTTNPRHERRDRARLARAQRQLARKAKEDGANRAKARRKVARVHARIADRRRDTLHKITTRLVRQNQTIVIEDLTVRNLLKNIDRRFPSSKLCSACGRLQGRMPLHVRTWTCECGTAHDRDENAAKNLLAAGPAVSACGAGVRPQRSSPSGQSAMKQERPRREP
ncbi:RNA-guided endonuclease InsQ/TnpB family protein [Streptomyces shenzhenensis]|uniref:RNA-guided endonuclease InsQ/TnpB family protein n=1 Tax=Streptomyces shenzhenensis TaxID=943815 RepID=UPI0036B4705A